MGVMIPTKARCGGCGVGCKSIEPYFESPTSAHPQTQGSVIASTNSLVPSIAMWNQDAWTLIPEEKF